ncbi:MAG: DUF2070 family protein [Candidatus Micrarchaeia archaeon]
MAKKPSDPFGDNSIFMKGIPHVQVMLTILFLLGIAVGIGAVALMEYPMHYALLHIIITGMVTGTFVLVLPTLITVIIFKALKRYVLLKHVLFIAFVGVAAYSVFMLLGNAIYAIAHNYALASAIIIVGDASIFGWWFFINKVILGRQKSGVILPLIQPTLNILVYIPYSKFIFSFNTPINVLLLKLYAGILIFLVMSYMILYIFNKPFKKSIGFQGIDTMSQFVQNWLFNIDVNPPFGIARIGVNSTVDTSTIVFKKGSKIKGIFFLPEIHYGPMGTLGGSNFPYMLERFGSYKYKAPLFAMHGAVNVDNNPIASSQISMLEKTLEKSVRSALMQNGTTRCSFYESKYGSASLSVLAFGGFGLATFTRAPRVTEDVEPAVGMSIKSKLEGIFGKAAVIDAHNSRYETAPPSELAGVTANSNLAREYLSAIEKLGKPIHKTRSIRLGIASVELFNAMGRPKDLAPGNLNVAIFAFNGFKYAIIYFNANNMLPKLRAAIINHVKEKYGINAEVYTTDTHMVNKLDLDAANVLGRHSSQRELLKIIDKAVSAAIADIEEVRCYYYTQKIRNFKIWGQNARERIGAVLNSVYEIAKVLVPVIIAGAFIIAALIILAI